MTVGAAATHFKVHASTIRSWIRRGCPCIESGSVGRGHGSRLDHQAVERWLIEQRVPSVAVQAERDVLAIAETALSDLLKRDRWMGQTLPAERFALLFYERLFRNIKQRPLQANDLPAELKRIVTNYLDSIERRIF